jgi:hypothetical protein
MARLFNVEVIGMSFRVVAVSAEVAGSVRATSRSPQYGHPTSRETATGYGPCRSCLRTFRVGEEDRVMFTFDPFEGTGVPSAPGPVFVHADACEPFEGEGFPPGLRELPLMFEAYGEDGLPRVRVRTGPEAIEGDIARLLGDPAHRFVLVRNAEAGCYVARVERPR